MQSRFITTLEYGRGPVFNRALHRFAVFLAGCTLILITAGGMVTSTDSGLSVPDWPTTYGHNMFTYPPAKWVGGIFYEHGHRLIASTVGFLTIILAVWLKLRERRTWLRRLGFVALAAVIFQGILGGMTVLYLLPTWISVFHACLAQTFFCLMVSIAIFTSRWWIERPVSPDSAAGRTTYRDSSGVGELSARPSMVHRWCIAAVIAVFAQLVLGATMRHSDAGLAVPDFPLAYGQVVPSLSHEAIATYNQERAFEHFLPEVSRRQILIHMLHRVGAVAVALVLLAAALIAARSGVRKLRSAAFLAVFLLVIQITLGALTVWTGKVPAIATAHVATGAALMGTCWALALRSIRLRATAPATNGADLAHPALAGLAS